MRSGCGRLRRSCTADFNPARLERYLALARSAGVEPVYLLTKADLAADPRPWRERAEPFDRRVAVRVLDARAPDPERTLGDWCRPGQNVALAGSSGVGKSTLANALTGAAEATAPIREDDARGRYTATGGTCGACPEEGG
jgi:ribosome biogenesis GTPase / thiamine phosphate phosphatase